MPFFILIVLMRRGNFLLPKIKPQAYAQAFYAENFPPKGKLKVLARCRKCLRANLSYFLTASFMLRKSLKILNRKKFPRVIRY